MKREDLIGAIILLESRGYAFESYISPHNLLLKESLGLCMSNFTSQSSGVEETSHWRGVKLPRTIPFSREVKDGGGLSHLFPLVVKDCLRESRLIL